MGKRATEKAEIKDWLQRTLQRNPDSLAEQIGNECLSWRNGHPCGCVTCKRARAVYDLMTCARTMLDTPGIDLGACRRAVERVEQWKET